MIPQLLQQGKKVSEKSARHISTEKVFEAKIPLDMVSSTITKAAGKAKVILIGEASHGTQEFYQIRAQLTQKFMDEDQDFNLVMVEGDFPPFYALNKALKSKDKNYDAEFDALKSRFPHWMWVIRYGNYSITNLRETLLIISLIERMQLSLEWVIIRVYYRYLFFAQISRISYFLFEGEGRRSE